MDIHLQSINCDVFHLHPNGETISGSLTLILSSEVRKNQSFLPAHLSQSVARSIHLSRSVSKALFTKQLCLARYPYIRPGGRFLCLFVSLFVLLFSFLFSGTALHPV